LPTIPAGGQGQRQGKQRHKKSSGGFGDPIPLACLHSGRKYQGDQGHAKDYRRDFEAIHS